MCISLSEILLSWTLDAAGLIEQQARGLVSPVYQKPLTVFLFTVAVAP